MDKDNPLDDFLAFFESASEKIRSFSKLYRIGNYSPLDCYWEDMYMIEEDMYETISKEDFTEAVRLNELYSKLTSGDKYKSRINQYQCWMCRNKIYPENCAHGITVCFQNANGKVIKELDCIQCSDCNMKYQLDETPFILKN
jgi:hypothetical protein